MPRLNVIVLDQDQTDANTYHFLMWADVPSARQSRYANPTATSLWPDAQAADITALRNGSVVEKLASQRVASGSTLAQAEAAIQAQWTAYQAFITANNPWARYGSTWDGTTWVVLNNG